ncbi:DUF2975 domain-containing protein [Streptococcus pacificus]|uniref:DUF2975 domain-containing protein n=1 Tax=Streptococcus pacificus TaxID=2740577 RepID=A0ABS0ZKP4_9STRE|nr:DUF2975 domain-containing protein [Streptococcus pacificus]MBJ8326473.1 DUF2975 domain-containing protein [Streptococcus pacificus]
MTKENAYLRYILGFINVLLVILTISLVFATIFFALGITDLKLFNNTDMSFTMSLKEVSPLANILNLANGYIVVLVLYCVRQFFKNILADKIFVAHNVLLAKRVALLLVIASFFGNGIFQFQDYSFFNPTYIITALVVWTLSKVLEKANDIAAENEFTI